MKQIFRRNFAVSLLLTSLVSFTVPIFPHDTGEPVAGGSGSLLGPGEFGVVDLVGRLVLTDPNHIIGDVAVSPDGNWAFLANVSCNQEPKKKKTEGAGVWVIDISDPANPLLTGFIPAVKGTRPGEGLQVVALTTESFDGWALVMNSEPCGEKGRGGFSLYDVTNPLSPKKLSEYFVPKPWDKAVVTDSVFAWDAGESAYAAISLAGSTEFVILDITRLNNPQPIGSFTLEEFFPGGILQPELGLVDAEITDILVKQIGPVFVMVLSAGDAGQILLNVTDPINVVGLAQTEFSSLDSQLLEKLGISEVPEGNAHNAGFTADNLFLIGTDEDSNPYGGSSLSGFDGWGYVHLYITDPLSGYIEEVDTYAIREALDPAFAFGFGNLSVHEVATHPEDPTRAYLAYRAGGLRLLEIPSFLEAFVEIGGYLGPQGNDFWGVEAFIKDGTTYILVSDRETGLYIFEDTTATP